MQLCFDNACSVWCGCADEKRFDKLTKTSLCSTFTFSLKLIYQLLSMVSRRKLLKLGGRQKWNFRFPLCAILCPDSGGPP